MAEQLKWSELELHIEHLLPGILLCLEAYLIAPPSWIDQMKVPDPFIAGAGFVALSYSVGVVLSTVSRRLIDSQIERGLRAKILKRHAHARLEALETVYGGDRRFQIDLESELAKHREVWVAKWNAVYRAAMRRAQSPEVHRRRAQGRLMRALVAPFIFGAGIGAAHLPGALGLRIGAVVVAGFVTAFVMLRLFAYSEYTAAAEALDIISEVMPEGPTAASGPEMGSAETP